MKLLVGLGNPGLEYRFHRHNIGFRVVDAFIDSVGLSFSGDKFKSSFYEGVFEGATIKAIKPTTYMNLSGEAVLKAVSFFKISLSDVWVVYDDFDLSFGTIRLRPSGSPGTHNGARSVTDSLGSQAFPRLRIGIGPKPSNRTVNSFVLSNFTTDESLQLEDIIDRSVRMIKTGFGSDVQAAMTQWNGSGQS